MEIFFWPRDNIRGVPNNHVRICIYLTAEVAVLQLQRSNPVDVGCQAVVQVAQLPLLFRPANMGSFELY